MFKDSYFPILVGAVLLVLPIGVGADHTVGNEVWNDSRSKGACSCGAAVGSEKELSQTGITRTFSSFSCDGAPRGC